MGLVHEKSAPLTESQFRLTCFVRISSSRSDLRDSVRAASTAMETIYSIQCNQCPKVVRCSDKEDCISRISQHAGTTGCFVKATGCTDEAWKELFNQKTWDWCQTLPCSESQQAIAPPTTPRAPSTSAIPAASAVPAVPAAPEAGAAPTTPKSPAAAQRGGSSCSTVLGTAYLQQMVAASASVARVSAGAASVSSASAAASATKIESNLEVLRETLSEVLQLTLRLYHYARPIGTATSRTTWSGVAPLAALVKCSTGDDEDVTCSTGTVRIAPVRIAAAMSAAVVSGAAPVAAAAAGASAAAGRRAK